MTGHLLGAAGAMEAAATVLGIYHHTIHPTINLEEKDEDCDLDYVPQKPKNGNSQCNSNSFSLEGIMVLWFLENLRSNIMSGWWL